jgi:hypothetical protein
MKARSKNQTIKEIIKKAKETKQRLDKSGFKYEFISAKVKIKSKSYFSQIINGKKKYPYVLTILDRINETLDKLTCNHKS